MFNLYSFELVYKLSPEYKIFTLDGNLSLLYQGKLYILKEGIFSIDSETNKVIFQKRETISENIYSEIVNGKVYYCFKLWSEKENKKNIDFAFINDTDSTYITFTPYSFDYKSSEIVDGLDVLENDFTLDEKIYSNEY